METNNLKKAIQSVISEIISPCGYKRVPNENIYPHATFSLLNENYPDMYSGTYLVDVDLWDKGNSSTKIDKIADEIVHKINFESIPQKEILPVFYVVSKNYVDDDDPQIQHIAIRMEVENFIR